MKSAGYTAWTEWAEATSSNRMPNISPDNDSMLQDREERKAWFISKKEEIRN
jgi:hypothetical protein